MGAREFPAPRWPAAEDGGRRGDITASKPPGPTALPELPGGLRDLRAVFA